LSKEISLPAFAKINLSLRVLGKRDDGLHEIETIFQTVSLCDTLTFSSVEDERLELTCNDSNIPVDENNLIIRAANALREKYNIKRGARIHLEKKIPSPGGLGGGSSDAAISLLALASLWNIKASKDELENIGTTLGADVPFFFTGGTALGTSLGNEINPLKDLPKRELLIVTPNVCVPTAEAYKSLNATRLTKKTGVSILASSRLGEIINDSIQTVIHNDFEPVIFRLKPEIESVKKALIASGSNVALMSGSGASVFGIFDNVETRERAIALLSEEKTWRVFSCSTVTREEYLKALEPCSKILHG
jgi:4-diphosphocytidyl-2-C-methyl-D-erythritol kinase